MPFNFPILLTWLRVAMIPLVVGVFYLPDTWMAQARQAVSPSRLRRVTGRRWSDGSSDSGLRSEPAAPQGRNGRASVGRRRRLRAAAVRRRVWEQSQPSWRAYSREELLSCMQQRWPTSPSHADLACQTDPEARAAKFVPGQQAEERVPHGSEDQDTHADDQQLCVEALARRVDLQRNEMVTLLQLVTRLVTDVQTLADACKLVPTHERAIAHLARRLDEREGQRLESLEGQVEHLSAVVRAMNMPVTQTRCTQQGAAEAERTPEQSLSQRTRDLPGTPDQ